MLYNGKPYHLWNPFTGMEEEKDLIQEFRRKLGVRPACLKSLQKLN